MVDTVLVISTLLIALLFLVLGIQFQRGKWLQLIDGNTFGELSKSDPQKAGKCTSYCMYIVFLFFLAIAFCFGTENLKILRLLVVFSVLIGAFGIFFCSQRVAKK